MYPYVILNSKKPLSKIEIQEPEHAYKTLPTLHYNTNPYIAHRTLQK